MEHDTLDQALLAAHAAGDMPLMVRLYHEAGTQFLASGKVNAGCFYLTHAYIYALDCGDKSAREIHKTLVAHGREA